MVEYIGVPVPQRPASTAFSLFAWWQSVPPGVGVEMDEMRAQFGYPDPQVIRNALVQLRRGRVPDPASPGHYLRPLPIQFHWPDRKYYDFSRINPNAVAAQVPGTVLNNRFADLLSRATNLDNTMGAPGLVRSAEQLLNDRDTRLLIAQLPLPQIWAAANVLLQAAQARQLLEIEALRAQDAAQLAAGGGERSEE